MTLRHFEATSGCVSSSDDEERVLRSFKVDSSTMFDPWQNTGSRLVPALRRVQAARFFFGAFRRVACCTRSRITPANVASAAASAD